MGIDLQKFSLSLNDGASSLNLGLAVSICTGLVSTPFLVLSVYLIDRFLRNILKRNFSIFKPSMVLMFVYLLYTLARFAALLAMAATQTITALLVVLPSNLYLLSCALLSFLWVQYANQLRLVYSGVPPRKLLYLPAFVVLFISLLLVAATITCPRLSHSSAASASENSQNIHTDARNICENIQISIEAVGCFITGLALIKVNYDLKSIFKDLSIDELVSSADNQQEDHMRRLVDNNGERVVKKAAATFCTVTGGGGLPPIPSINLQWPSASSLKKSGSGALADTTNNSSSLNAPPSHSSPARQPSTLSASSYALLLSDDGCGGGASSPSSLVAASPLSPSAAAGLRSIDDDPQRYMYQQGFGGATVAAPTVRSSFAHHYSSNYNHHNHHTHYGTTTANVEGGPAAPPVVITAATGKPRRMRLGILFFGQYSVVRGVLLPIFIIAGKYIGTIMSLGCVFYFAEAMAVIIGIHVVMGPQPKEEDNGEGGAGAADDEAGSGSGGAVSSGLINTNISASSPSIGLPLSAAAASASAALIKKGSVDSLDRRLLPEGADERLIANLHMHMNASSSVSASACGGVGIATGRGSQLSRAHSALHISDANGMGGGGVSSAMMFGGATSNPTRLSNGNSAALGGRKVSYSNLGDLHGPAPLAVPSSSVCNSSVGLGGGRITFVGGGGHNHPTTNTHGVSPGPSPRASAVVPRGGPASPRAATPTSSPSPSTVVSRQPSFGRRDCVPGATCAPLLVADASDGPHHHQRQQLMTEDDGCGRSAVAVDAQTLPPTSYCADDAVHVDEYCE